MTQSLLREYASEGVDIHDPGVFLRYYHDLYVIRGVAEQDESDSLVEALRRHDFETVAREYRVIDQDAINVLVPYDQEVFEELAAAARSEGLTRRWVARARPHAVGLFRPRPGHPLWDHLESIPVGRCGETAHDWFIYTGGRDHYRQDVGLAPPKSLDCLIA